VFMLNSVTMMIFGFAMYHKFYYTGTIVPLLSIILVLYAARLFWATYELKNNYKRKKRNIKWSIKTN